MQDKPGLKKRFYNQGSSNTQKINKVKGPIPKPHEIKGSNPYIEKPICAKCGTKHEGKCLVGTGNCYGCGKGGHKIGIVLL